LVIFERTVMNATTPVEPKQSYEAPVLSEYGDIGEVTQNANVTPSAAPDGGVFPNPTKTH
jgi:hypothetical protein